MKLPIRMRQAASLILVAKNSLIKHSSNADDFQILALKRGSTSSSFPGFHAFPGGHFDKADELADWLKCFPSSELEVPLNLVDKNGNPVYSAGDSDISLAISLRITAIRETFEECGILLCKRKTDYKRTVTVGHFEIEDVKEWRERVRKNANEFLTLCLQHDCYPCVSNLHLIGNWITPFSLPRRVDCKFFIALMENAVNGECDNSEIEEIKWHSPDFFLKEPGILLPPVQFYKISELKKIRDYSTLYNSLSFIDKLTCIQIIPVHVHTTNGMVIILPGDEKYDQIYDMVLKSKHTIETGCDMVSYRGKVMHRMEFITDDKISNIKDKGIVVVQNCDSTFSNILKSVPPNKDASTVEARTDEPLFIVKFDLRDQGNGPNFLLNFSNF